MHNHPPGDPTPSQADIQVTEAIVQVATPLGIAVHDHIVVGTNGHASLKGTKLIQLASSHGVLLHDHPLGGRTPSKADAIKENRT